MVRFFTFIAILVVLPGVTAALTVTLDQEVYVVGDVIEITFDNSGGDTVEFPSEPPFSIHRLDGDYDGMTGLPVIVELAAGGIMVQHWDTGMLPDPAGQYEVAVTWWYQQNPDEVFEFAVPYTLEESVGAEMTTWSAVRRLFR
jgi:hypothetical protein